MTARQPPRDGHSRSDRPDPGPIRLVLALDGSEGAAVAERLVRNGQWPAGTRVLLVSALGDVALRLASWSSPSEASLVDAAARASLAAVQADAAIALSERGLETSSRLSGGRPADTLLSIGREEAPDAIVVGSRGLGPIEALLLGSTSVEVVVRSRCTVLVARRDAVRRVLLAVDGSTPAHRAERLVATWPLFADAEVRVLSVAPPGEAGEAQAQRLAVGAANRLRRAGVAATAEVGSGDPAAAILDAASRLGADLVALGARGTDGPTRAGLGRVARNVLSAGPSVLVVRRPPSREA